MSVILITGASSGIGKATVELFHKQGWTVAAAMKDKSKMAIFEGYKNVQSYLMDVLDTSTIKKCIDAVVLAHGSIDVVVNNAGIYETDPFEMMIEDTVRKIIDTNVLGSMLVTQAIIPHFRQKKQGKIINISSIAGRVTFPYQAVYHSSKWAIEGFSESIRYELTPFNISVKVVEPGVVKTNLYSSTLGKSLTNYPTDYKDNFEAWYTYLTKGIMNGYDPGLDAETVFKAVNDESNKFRYTTDLTTRFAFFMRSLSSLNFFQKIVSRQIA